MKELEHKIFDLKLSYLPITAGTIMILLVTGVIAAAGTGISDADSCEIAGEWEAVASGGLGSINILFDASGSGTGNASIGGNTVEYNFQGNYTSNNTIEGNWNAGFLQGTFIFTFSDGSNCDSATGEIRSIANTLAFNATRLIPVNSSGSITRSISQSNIMPENILVITLTPSQDDIFGAPGYNVTETIPPGFTYINATSAVSVTGNVLTFTQMGNSPFSYTVRASSINGSYTISGTFIDRLSRTGIVGGITNIRVGGSYDDNGNGRIERDEAIHAVVDYFNENITKQEATDIIIAYFRGDHP